MTATLHADEEAAVRRLNCATFRHELDVSLDAQQSQRRSNLLSDIRRPSQGWLRLFGLVYPPSTYAAPPGLPLV